MVEDFDMITDFMDDDEDQPINMDKQLRIILFEPLSQLDKAALRKLTDYLKLMSEFLGSHILKPYS
jgi:GMP synthase PP-ATPase subunit